MKKRNRLGLISSLLGVFALCGLSALAIFSKPKRTQSVSASMTQTTLQNVTCTFDTDLSMYSITSYFKDIYDSFPLTFTNVSERTGVITLYNLTTYIGGSSSSALDYREFDSAFRSSLAIEYSYKYNDFTKLNAEIWLVRNGYVVDTSKPLIDQSINQTDWSQNLFPILECWYYGTNPIFTNYDLNFVNGVDKENDDLLSIFNYCCDFLYMNSYTDSDITQQQYLDALANLNQTIYDLREDVDFLTEQIQVSYDSGYNAGVNSQIQWLEQNTTTIYNQGYTDGYNNGSSQDETVATIFSGILQVAFVPVNFFLSIFNFEILGINLSGFIRAIFTVTITIIVIRLVFGKGGGSE